MKPAATLLALLAFVVSCEGKDGDTSCYEGFERNADGACMAERPNNGPPPSTDGGETTGDGSSTTAGADTPGEPTDGGGTATDDGGTTGSAEGGATGGVDGEATGGIDGEATGAGDGVADGSSSAGATVGGDPTGGTTVGGDEAGDATGGATFDPCAGREVGTEVGKCAQNFTLIDADGVEVSLYDFYGQVIVLDLSGFG